MEGREDIVITGISCRFASAADPGAFWRNILRQKACFTPLSLEGVANPFHRKMPSGVASLGPLYAYYPRELKLSKTPLDGVNPDLFFAMQLVSDALRDSQPADRAAPHTDQVSLRLGMPPPFNPSAANWIEHTLFLSQTIEILQGIFPSATREQLADIREHLEERLPKLTPDSTYSALACTMASEIAERFEFAGPATMIEAGSLSAHEALAEAIDDLRTRRADIAVAGAVQSPLPISSLEGLSGALNFTSAPAAIPFSRDADGTLPGEGGAVFVLKRLKDAEKARDRIYAILRSIGTASPYQPRRKHAIGDVLGRAITRSIASADIGAESIGYVECAADGDPALDKIELETLYSVYGIRRPGAPLTGIGSVKGNYGETLWASGAAGLLKATLALYHRLLPPNVETLKPHPKLASAKSALYLLTETRPWLSGGRALPRRAGVTSISSTGTCGAAVLEEYPG